MRAFSWIAYGIASVLSLGLAGSRPAGVCPDAAAAKACPCGQGEGFTIVKAFPLNLKEGTSEYTYVFTSGADYLITVCGPEGQNLPLKVNILDGYRQPLFDNYDKRAHQYRQRMGYVCGQTGVVHLKLEPAKGAEGCAYVFVGFKPQ